MSYVFFIFHSSCLLAERGRLGSGAGAIERLRGSKRACSALFDAPFDAPIFILKNAKCPRYISGSGTRLACETRNRPCTKEVLARMGSCQSRDLTTFLRVWAEVVITYLTNRLVWLTPLLGVTGYCLGCVLLQLRSVRGVPQAGCTGATFRGAKNEAATIGIVFCD